MQSFLIFSAHALRDGVVLLSKDGYFWSKKENFKEQRCVQKVGNFSQWLQKKILFREARGDNFSEIKLCFYLLNQIT